MKTFVSLLNSIEITIIRIQNLNNKSPLNKFLQNVAWNDIATELSAVAI